MERMSWFRVTILACLLAYPAIGAEELPIYELPESLSEVAPDRPEFVARLVADVVQEHPGASEEAWRVLGALGRPAVPAVVRALPGAAWLGRSHLIAALAQSGVAEVEPVLLIAGEDPSWAVREAAAYGLARGTSPRAAAVLALLSRDASWRVRAAACLSLRMLVTRGVTSRDQAIPVLLDRVQDKDRDVRLIALRELGHLQADEARTAFLAGMKEDDEVVHDLCFNALTDLKDAREDLILAMRAALDHSDETVFLSAAEKYAELTGTAILDSEIHLRRLLNLLRTQTIETSKVFREVGRPAVPILLEDLRRFYSIGRRLAAGDYGPLVLDLVHEILAEEAAPILEEILLEWEEADSVRRHAVRLGSRYHARAMVGTFKKAYREGNFRDIRSALLRGIAAADDPELQSLVREALASGDTVLIRTARRIVEDHPALEVGDALVKAAENEQDNPELAAVLVRLLITRKHPEALRVAKALLTHQSPRFRRTGAGPIRFFTDAQKALTLLSLAYHREDGRNREEALRDGGEEETAEEDRERWASLRQQVVKAILSSAQIVGGEEALPLIAEAARDQDPVIREAAMIRAAHIDAPGSLALAMSLIEHEADDTVIAAALRVIVGYEDAAAQSLLTRLLLGAEERQRLDVLRALRRSESAHIPTPVIESLSAGGWGEEARLIAVEALGNRVDPAHVPILSKLVREETSLEVRSAAAQALGATGDPAAVSVLLDLLPDSGELFRGDLAELRSIAVEVLGELGSPTAVPQLLALLEDEWNRTVNSPEGDSRHFHATDLLLTAIGRTGDNRAVYPLLTLLFSPALHQSFTLLDQSPPRDRRSLIGSLVRALVRFPDDRLMEVGKVVIEDLRQTGDIYRIDEGYLAYIAGLLADPRSEEIRLPRPRRGLAALLFALTLETVPRESAADLAAITHLSAGAAARHDFKTAAELAARGTELSRLLDPTTFREEEDVLRANLDFLAGMELLKAGREEEGMVRYRAGRARDPEEPQILNLFAWYLADTGLHLDLALEAAMAAGQRAPSDPFVIDTIGWTLHRRGEHLKAVRRLNLAVSLDMDDSERTSGRHPDPLLLYHLAAAWSRAGFPGNGATCLSRAVRMDDTLALFARQDADFEPIREAGLFEKAVKDGLGAIRK